MIEFKDRNSMIYSAFLICLVDKCNEEAEKLWSTETNVVDVCLKHYKQLEIERYPK